MNNKLSYLNRNYDDLKNSLLNYIKTYYPQIADDFDDASIGSWLIDMVASVGDTLNFYIDKAYNETNLDSAKNSSSIYNIARTNGFKVPGPKGSMAEVEFSCILPVYENGDNGTSSLGMPDWSYAPVIKRGTKVTSKNQVFEVMNDINFNEHFDYNGVQDRKIIPLMNANQVVDRYKVSKKAVVVAGESKIYRQVIKGSDIKPFMEFILPDVNVMDVESIIFKDGSDFQADPTMNDFMIGKEIYQTNDNSGTTIYRFFEVDYLAEQYRWGDDIPENSIQANRTIYTYDSTDKPVYCVCKGKWIPITQKFITEFTDTGYLKVIFGSGESVGQNIPDGVLPFSAYQMSKMIRNNFMGKLPQEGWTMYVLYRVGGGASSNVAKGTINYISYLNAEIGSSLNFDCETAAKVKNSITVTNTTPSVSGKDAPTPEEIKNLIKYNIGAQERCVTVKDYENRILTMPSRYGCPFRVSVSEENNKVMAYILGVDGDGKLCNIFPSVMIYNILNYLTMYRSINDFVEIKAGKVINLSFEVDLFVDKNFNAADIANSVINTISDYMSINKHYIGEDIFVGDIERNVSNIDGVLNLIEMRVYNEYGNNYSKSKISQAIIDDESTNERDKIDLDDANYVLNSDMDSMFEIKYPNTDIKVRMKAR